MLMTAIQLNALNAQIQENISLLSDSEMLMKRLAKYVSKLVKENGTPTLFVISIIFVSNKLPLYAS